MTLFEHLAACTRETRLRIGVNTPATSALAAALADDAKMATQAAELVASTVGVEPRDHLTRWRNTLLRAALANIVALRELSAEGV